MPDPTELEQAVESAERAAQGGDFAGAEGYLREAVALQESTLGPAHPDVANTLNNLGVVCERLDKPEEAEECYRRACAIVTAALPPDHPSVATSRRNLEDFCAARNLPLAAPEPGPEPAPASKLVPAPEPVPGVEATRRESPLLRDNRPAREQPRHEPAQPPAPLALPVRRWTDRPGLVAALGAIAGVLIVGFWLSRTPQQTGAAPTPQPAAPSDAAAPSTAPSAPPASARIAPPKPSPPPDKTTPNASRMEESRKQEAALRVIEARLCTDLGPGKGGEWTCRKPSDPVHPGVLFFYTRLASSHEAVVVHRWYRDDRLQRSRELQIHANSSSGYRTYSRYTLNGDSAGHWRVELRTRDGRLLHEEQFVVR